MLPHLPQSNIIIIDKLQRTAMNATLCHQRDQCFGAPLKTARKIESTHTTTKKKAKTKWSSQQAATLSLPFQTLRRFFPLFVRYFLSAAHSFFYCCGFFFCPKANGNKVSASAVGCDKT